MSETYIKDEVHFIAMLKKFIAYVIDKDKTNNVEVKGLISFTDPNGMLGKEENYKSNVAGAVRKAMCLEKWKLSYIGTGVIANYMINAIGKDVNLINYNQVTLFIDKLKENERKAEEILYNIYKTPNNPDSFKNAVKFFGGKYDLISFLFFIKDSNRFLSTRSTIFDSAFNKLHINFKMKRRCEWGNYETYLEIINEIRKKMVEYPMPMAKNASIRLIDAHSFVWIINEQEFEEYWNDNKEEERIIERDAEIECQSQTEKQEVKHQDVIVRSRSREVIEKTKHRAKGICQLCKKPAPFESSDGTPYLEVHHIEWLSRGGLDNINNTVALCPNCHAKMHIVDDPVDVIQLKNIVKNYMNELQYSKS